MSKALDALERLISLAAYGSACVEASCKEPECVEAKTALATLRGYITTTEAKGEALAITAGNLMIERDESAARIKELEEALQESWVRSNSYAKRLVNEGHDDVVWYATNPSALSGARKVEPEGLKGERDVVLDKA